MQVHARAALSAIGRRLVVDRILDEGWSVTAAAEAAGVTERTVYRWLARFRAHGACGLVDRPPIPRRVPGRTPADRVAVICELRQLRVTGAEIAERLSMPLSVRNGPILTPSEAVAQSPRVAGRFVRWRGEDGAHATELLEV